jgi:hypothetical protein
MGFHVINKGLGPAAQSSVAVDQAINVIPGSPSKHTIHVFRIKYETFLEKLRVWYVIAID